MGTGIEQVYSSVGMKNYITQAFIMKMLSIVKHSRELPLCGLVFIRRLSEKH